MTTPTPREAAAWFNANPALWTANTDEGVAAMAALLDHARATDPAAGGDLATRIEQLGNRLGADGIVSRRTANEVREALHSLVDELRSNAAAPASEAATEGVRWSARHFTQEDAANEPPGWSAGWNVIGEVGDDPDPLVRVVYVLAVDQAHDGDGGDCSAWLARNIVATLNTYDAELALHDAHYAGAGESERSHDAWAQRRGFNSSGELHAWVDARLGSPSTTEGGDLGVAGVREVIDALRNDMGPLGGLDRETLGHRLAGSLRSLLAATPREQGTAEAATEGRDGHGTLHAGPEPDAETWCADLPGNYAIAEELARIALGREPSPEELDRQVAEAAYVLDAIAAIRARAATPREQGTAEAATEGARALAIAVRARREEMGLRQSDLQGRGGPSTGTVRNIEQAARGHYASRTYPQLDNALEWSSGTARSIAHRCAPPAPEVVSTGDLAVEFIGAPTDRWHRWAVRPDCPTAAEVVATLLPRVHAVRVHRGTCGGLEPGGGS